MTPQMQMLIEVLGTIAAWLVYGLGIFYTLGRWGLTKSLRLQALGLAVVFFVLLELLTQRPLFSFPAAVTLSALVLPVPLHRLRFLDGMGLWMPVGLALLISAVPSLGGGKTVFPQLLLLFGFVALRQIFGMKFYRRFGQMYFLSLTLCMLALTLCVPELSFRLMLPGLLFSAAGAAGFFWVSFHQPPQKPLLLFDLDGTLIDSQQLVFETFRQVFARKKPGYPLSEQELYSFFGPTLESTFSRYFSEDEIPDVIDLYQSLNLKLHPQFLRPMPHAQEVLESLHTQGFKMAIVSNKRRRPVEYGLELTGLSPYFEAVFAKEDLPVPKPAPDGLIHAAKSLNTPLDQVIYVGDNPSDIQAARGAAFFSAGYTLDETQLQALQNEHPCRILKDLRQLEPMVKENMIWIDKQIW